MLKNPIVLVIGMNSRILGFQKNSETNPVLQGKGANVILGPSVNVHRGATGGRNFEYLSGEAQLWI